MYFRAGITGHLYVFTLGRCLLKRRIEFQISPRLSVDKLANKAPDSSAALGNGGRMDVSTPRAPHFFDAVDWLGFAITSMVVFAIYLRTITPDLALGYGGIFATSALYGGPALPPGYPVQTLYSWAIIKLLPFGNIAFRVALASSLAGAFAAGVLALFVSSSAKSVWADLFAGRLGMSGTQKYYGWSQAAREAWAWDLSALFGAGLSCLIHGH